MELLSSNIPHYDDDYDDDDDDDSCIDYISQKTDCKDNYIITIKIYDVRTEIRVKKIPYFCKREHHQYSQKV